MALLKFKRSAVSGKVPALTDLELGELAINTFDGKLYMRKDNGTASIIEVGGGSGVLSFNSRTGAVTLTSGDVTGALGYTPYNSSNPAGYITGITSGNVTTALGYTPANKAGDTFTGAVTINSGSHQVYLAADGNIEITRSGGGAYIDFKNSTGEDFDARIQESGGLLNIANGVRTNIYYDIDNTSYYADPANTSVINGLNVGTNTPQFSNGSFQYWQIQSPHVAYIKKTGGYSWYWRRNDTGLIGGANEVEDMSLTEGGNLLVRSDVRAPMFYDSNDTGYYLNPNGFSKVLTFGVMGEREYPGSINSDWEGGYYHFGPSNDTPNGTYGHAHIIRLDANWNVQMFFPTTNTNEPFWIRRKQSGTYSAWRRMIQEDEWIGSKYFGSDGTIYAAASSRAPIFYDYDNTGYYLDPNNTSNVYRIAGSTAASSANSNWVVSFQNTPVSSYQFHGDINSGGPQGTWWFYESRRHDNGSNYWGTQVAWGWEDNANELWQRNVSSGSWSGWVRYLNSGNYSGYCNFGGNAVYGGIYYDGNDTGYWVNPNGGQSANFAGDITMGPELNMVAGSRSDRYIDVKGDLYFRYTDNSSFYYSKFLIRASGNIHAYVSLESEGDIIAYSSDRRLKKNITPIANALEKVSQIGGYTFDWDMEKCEEHGFTPTNVHEHGVIAQEIEAVMPDVVVHAPFDRETRPNHDMTGSKSGEWFKTVNYDKIVPLLIEAIKELKAEVESLKAGKE